jgi:exodeoxyribonuclease VII large subunit
MENYNLLIKNDTITVSTLTNRIRSVLESDFTNVDVQGEISNFKLHSSGHIYFSLKDDKAQLKCVIWRGRTLSFKPTDGMKVIARGSITVYPPQGNYQLDCHDLRQVGQGDLHLAFEQLKAKLLDAGYFDQNKKKPIPKIPLNIGISTSPTGAAVQDMISTLKRRLPFTKLYFRPTLVQGDGSAEDIVRAIRELESSPAEVIIIGRGGGSIEDLWSYNTEIVANAIFNCKKPIISAVGHETDFTIADFVSDLRAPTPTAAAELASQISFNDLNEFFENSGNSLSKTILSRILDYKSGILERYSRFAKRRIIESIRRNSQFIDNSESKIQHYTKNKILKYQDSLSRMESHLKSLHPLSPLDKGFAILKHNGNIINKEISLNNFENIEIVRKIETVNAKIIKE